jgi:8-amino-3,8-dideoxy-alpha-D-manno-octulosonate transaminase
MSRCISTAINLSWTEEQLAEKGDKMVSAVKKALAGRTIPV